MDTIEIKEAKIDTLPEGVQALVDRFDMCAQRHGWEADQGNEMDAENAKACYEQAKAELEYYINMLLQNQAAK